MRQLTLSNCLSYSATLRRDTLSNHGAYILMRVCVLLLTLLALCACSWHKRFDDPSSVLNMNDVNTERQLLSGFYGIENNTWRWVRRDFFVMLGPPPGSAGRGAVLEMKFFIPEQQITQLGPVTLVPAIGLRKLPPITYSSGGSLLYRAELLPVEAETNVIPIDFRFDKAIAPTKSDARELAAVISSISLRTL